MTNQIGIAVALVTMLAIAAPVTAQSHDADTVGGDSTSSSACQAVDGQLPSNVQVNASLLPTVRTMLQRSDNFRRQCEELASHPTVYVRVNVTASGLPTWVCARSVIQRMAAGPLLVFVEIARTVNWAEWIAHEFEHVLEQAEGLRIKDLRAGRSNWESAEEVFETSRAIGAGRAVRKQMRRRPVATAATDN